MTYRSELVFPDGFLWGSASASYQVEGSVGADGRGASIWDTFAHTPGKTKNGDTGDVAVRHYEGFEGDLDLMASLHLNAYRFSISWPRVQPTGAGPLNARGLDYYRRLAEASLSRGLLPVVTLYHWDLPQSLEDRGGWPERDTALRFADYALSVSRAMAGLVELWVTLNEPSVSSLLGYALGSRAPGRSDLPSGVLSSHHLLLGHGLAVAAIRDALGARAKVGLTLDPVPVEPGSDDPEDRLAADRVDAYWNRWFLDPVFRGCYPDELFEVYARAGARGYVLDGDMEVIAAPLDFLGVNYYTKHRVVAARAGGDAEGGATVAGYPPWLASSQVEVPGASRTAMGWEVRPEGLTEVLLRIKREYGDLPIYVTENGAAYDDYVGPDGLVHDAERIAYLDAHVRAVHGALDAGVDVRGYFVWTFVDNFEWTDGYSRRFGLVFVHFPDQTRYVKDSARWYGEVASSNRIGA